MLPVAIAVAPNGGRKVKASKDEPQYEVKSDKSGKTAVHKPDALDEK